MSSPNQNVDFSVDKNNLYREEAITDLKVASIRRLIPVKIDGSDDDSRPEIFMGHTQLMSPQGPIPIQAPLKAQTVEEALDEFPGEMKKAMDEVLDRIQKMQSQMKQQEQSRIITPGR